MRHVIDMQTSLRGCTVEVKRQLTKGGLFAMPALRQRELINKALVKGCVTKQAL